MKKQAKRMCHRLIQREDSEGNLYCPHPLHERTRAKQATTDSAQHSPVPYIIAEKNQSCILINESRLKYTQVFGAQSQANAAFIVRACNSHDAIVSALKTLRRFVIQDTVNFDEMLIAIDTALTLAKEA